MTNVVGVIQARMGSTRLPGKTMAVLGGRPLIDHVVTRVRESTTLDEVVVATTDQLADDLLVEHLVRQGVAVVRGPSVDVLARFALVVAATGATRIVRITADCPFIDPGVIDLVVSEADNPSPVDYCCNVLTRTYPIGMDCEVVTSAALARALAGATRALDREHVTPYIYGHPEMFSLRNVAAPDWARRPALRLTVDEESDLWLAQVIIDRLGDRPGLREILDLMDAEPELSSVNSHVLHRHTPKPERW